MKVKVKKTKKEFKPIKMEIVFESQEEINDLYNRVVISGTEIRERASFIYKEAGLENSWGIYAQLKNLV